MKKDLLKKRLPRPAETCWQRIESSPDEDNSSIVTPADLSRPAAAPAGDVGDVGDHGDHGDSCDPRERMEHVRNVIDNTFPAFVLIDVTDVTAVLPQPTSISTNKNAGCNRCYRIWPIFLFLTLLTRVCSDVQKFRRIRHQPERQSLNPSEKTKSSRQTRPNFQFLALPAILAILAGFANPSQCPCNAHENRGTPDFSKIVCGAPL